MASEETTRFCEMLSALVTETVEAEMASDELTTVGAESTVASK